MCTYCLRASAVTGITLCQETKGLWSLLCIYTLLEGTYRLLGVVLCLKRLVEIIIDRLKASVVLSGVTLCLKRIM